MIINSINQCIRPRPVDSRKPTDGFLVAPHFSTMSLLSLPPEILTQIFDHIDSSFFRENLAHLTVSKLWFEFARPTFLKNITLSAENLRVLVSSGATKEPSPLQDSLEALFLKIRGDQVRISRFYQEYRYRQGSNASNAPPAPDEFHGDNALETWLKDLDTNLAQLAIMAQKSRRLRVLRIQAWGYPAPAPLPSYDGYYYLSLPTMRALLSVENLSVLVLDLSTNFLISSRGRGGDAGGHICTAIGTLLGTLRTLHVRMRSICPDVLKPRDPNGSLRVSTVVVNLSLDLNLGGITSASHSRQCGPLSWGFLQLKADMREQAEALAARMASPKTVRILTHSYPNFRRQSLDVLTGKTMILEGDVAWDEDGETVEEYSGRPESDFSDDDSSFFDD